MHTYLYYNSLSLSLSRANERMQKRASGCFWPNKLIFGAGSVELPLVDTVMQCSHTHTHTRGEWSLGRRSCIRPSRHRYSGCARWLQNEKMKSSMNLHVEHQPTDDWPRSDDGQGGAGQGRRGNMPGRPATAICTMV